MTFFLMKISKKLDPDNLEYQLGCHKAQRAIEKRVRSKFHNQ